MRWLAPDRRAAILGGLPPAIHGGGALPLIGFLGLDWEPACLEFHRSNRAVQTPSRWQVREPIHRRSSGRWQRHADSLPAFDPDSFPGTAQGHLD